VDDLIETISNDPAVQTRYEEMRAAGTTHKLAELLATRSFPGLNGTDKAFNRGRCNGNQGEKCPDLYNYFQRIADAQGVSTTGRYYCHGLGRYPGDPRAWVSDTSDVLRIARERNLRIDGIVQHEGYAVEPAPDIPLAEDLWERDTLACLAESPGKRYEDAREEVFNVRSGKIKSEDLLVEDNVPHPADVLAEDE